MLSAWVNVEGWLLDGFCQGLHCRTGKEEAPRLILPLFWEETCLSFRRIVARRARKESDALWCSPVLGERGRCPLCSCGDLPCPLHNFISLFLTTWEKSLFVGVLFACAGVGELMGCDRIATIAEKTGRMAHFFQDTLSCCMIYLAC